jgi:4-oxalocrotonate tautomerase
MPWVDVKLYDTRVTAESVPRIIEAMTKALADSSGASPEHIHVIVQGVPATHWGVAGKPGA